VTTFAPRTADEVTEAIRWAVSAGEGFDVVAGGSKHSLGRPVDAPHRLDVSALSGVVSHEPAELILTAQPGTSREEIQALLAGHAQCLAFEPPDLTALLRTVDPAAGGTTETRGTLGGIVATGFSGPRRLKAGAVRDHVLGIAGVSGRAEFFVGGGKVVKNVTGYDIPKLMTGSHGTLAVLTEITLKVVPAPEDVRTLIVHGLSARDAVIAMTSILQTAIDVSAACHVPAGLATPTASETDSATAFRLEGFRPSVEFRLTRLRESVERTGTLAVLDREASVAFWRDVRDVRPFADGDDGIVWRLSVPPAQGAVVLERIERSIPAAQAFLDWGGGLIWVRLSGARGAKTVGAGGTKSETSGSAAEDPARSQLVRAALGETGGHATLMRAPVDVRAAVEVFQPQAAGLAALSKRVKAQFDPARVLNPGRMYAGV